MSGDDGVSSLIEYVMISGVLVALFIVMMLTINSIILEQPINNVLDRSFVDIGNGMSTRMVEVYTIAPPAFQDGRQSYQTGTIITKFDIPDDIAGRDYAIDTIKTPAGKDTLVISRGSIQKNISLAGIGASLSHGGVAGSTTSRGINQILYDWRGFNL